jgi:hypothetical protein
MRILSVLAMRANPARATADAAATATAAVQHGSIPATEHVLFFGQ